MKKSQKFKLSIKSRLSKVRLIIGVLMIFIGAWHLTNMYEVTKVSNFDIFSVIFFPLFGVYHILLAFGILNNKWA